MRKFEKTEENVAAPDGLDPFSVYRNDSYVVYVRDYDTKTIFFGKIKHLAFHKTDYSTNVSWRDKQHIKNEILGSDWDCVELNRSENRMVDNSNMYHMWCLPPGILWPTGWFTRVVSEFSENQSPWEEDVRPIDLKTKEEAAKLVNVNNHTGKRPTGY